MESSYLLRDTKLSVLKGIGDKTEKLFEKVGVDNLNQLLHFYPRTYDAYGEVVSYSELKSGEKASVRCVVTRPPVVKSGSKTQITILTLKDDFQTLEVIWYHMPYLRSTLKKGSVFVLRGIVVRRTGKWVMEHPEIFTMAAYEQMEGSIMPVYPLTSGLSNKTVQKAVKQIFERYEIEDYLPDDFKNKYSLSDRESALRNIHFPCGTRDLYAARNRLVFDEFLVFLLGLKQLKSLVVDKSNQFKITTQHYPGKIIKKLPYELTGAQKRVWEELKRDFTSEYTANRLIQGDVGSGKTIISFLSMLLMMENGYQSALMAPTEVLAMQHYKSLCSLIDSCAPEIDKPVLLTGSKTAKEKKDIYERIKTGQTKLIIGTHALIQEKVEYNNLALVVTDEQHRFGVDQRTAFGQKGHFPHCLVMSATPIPRTMALIIYSDMKISVLDEMPAKRLRTKNAVVDTGYREKAYNFIAKEVANGHQAYVICPMIEKNEDFPCEDVIDYAKKLKKYYGDSINVDIMHGRMTPSEKDKVMLDFANGSTDILVSTTVVEVGVDVPNSTVMMIENADRFGLAQLHQLRGRIGRGDAQGYCIFVKSEGRDDDNERLDIISNSNDGFYIAEEDLKLRGQGDLFGLRQSGMAGFNIADIFEDRELLLKAQEACEYITNEDPLLETEKYQALKRVVMDKVQDNNLTL